MLHTSRVGPAPQAYTSGEGLDHPEVLILIIGKGFLVQSCLLDSVSIFGYLKTFNRSYYSRNLFVKISYRLEDVSSSVLG